MNDIDIFLFLNYDNLLTIIYKRPHPNPPPAQRIAPAILVALATKPSDTGITIYERKLPDIPR